MCSEPCVLEGCIFSKLKLAPGIKALQVLWHLRAKESVQAGTMMLEYKFPKWFIKAFSYTSVTP